MLVWKSWFRIRSQTDAKNAWPIFTKINTSAFSCPLNWLQHHLTNTWYSRDRDLHEHVRNNNSNENKRIFGSKWFRSAILLQKSTSKSSESSTFLSWALFSPFQTSHIHQHLQEQHISSTRMTYPPKGRFCYLLYRGFRTSRRSNEKLQAMLKLTCTKQRGRTLTANVPTRQLSAPVAKSWLIPQISYLMVFHVPLAKVERSRHRCIYNPNSNALNRTKTSFSRKESPIWISSPFQKTARHWSTTRPLSANYIT